MEAHRVCVLDRQVRVALARHHLRDPLAGLALGGEDVDVAAADDLEALAVVEDADAGDDAALAALGDAGDIAQGVLLEDVGVDDSLDLVHCLLLSGLQGPSVPVVETIVPPKGV